MQLFWAVEMEKRDDPLPHLRGPWGVSLVDIHGGDVSCSLEKRLWVNSLKDDWLALDAFLDGRVLSQHELVECPPGTPLSFDLNEFNEAYVLPT